MGARGRGVGVRGANFLQAGEHGGGAALVVASPQRLNGGEGDDVAITIAGEQVRRGGVGGRRERAHNGGEQFRVLLFGGQPGQPDRGLGSEERAEGRDPFFAHPRIRLRGGSH